MRRTLGTREPGAVDLLLPLLVAQAEEALPEITQEVRGGVGLPPGTPGLTEHPLCAWFAECPLCAGLRPQVHARSSALACQCAGAPVLVLFSVEKKTKPKANSLHFDISQSRGNQSFPWTGRVSGRT